MIDLSVLKKLSKQLNEHSITWGIGGSCLLMLYDLYKEPNDLDLWVKPSDMVKVRELLGEYEEIQTDIPLPKELHFKVIFCGVEVDFVACFIIKPNQYQFTYNICPENIHMITIGDIQVPCTYLEDWFIIYRLLKKDDKAKIIQEYFSNQQIEFNETAIDRAIQNREITLPDRVRGDIRILLFEATQLSFSLGDKEYINEQPASKKDNLTSVKKTEDIPVVLFDATQMSFPLDNSEE